MSSVVARHEYVPFLDSNSRKAGPQKLIPSSYSSGCKRQQLTRVPCSPFLEESHLLNNYLFHTLKLVEMVLSRLDCYALETS
jgi:hypothetical protein